MRINAQRALSGDPSLIHADSTVGFTFDNKDLASWYRIDHGGALRSVFSPAVRVSDSITVVNCQYPQRCQRGGTETAQTGCLTCTGALLSLSSVELCTSDVGLRYPCPAADKFCSREPLALRFANSELTYTVSMVSIVQRIKMRRAYICLRWSRMRNKRSR